MAMVRCVSKRPSRTRSRAGVELEVVVDMDFSLVCRDVLYAQSLIPRGRCEVL